MHSVILLAQLQSDKGLDAVLEIMRQTDEFAYYHLGDMTRNYYTLLFMRVARIISPQ